ncbi:MULTISPECIES: DegV family protein [unclassified Clostridium]|jgi:DegV family protein|uniref:DegV family protein n=1 Tax=unclassified Clostridium TaxID=2614128 RepID=UPI0025FE4CBC|nr:DegV family protein [Clostridium sp.]MDY2629905.1 DegV family protein [Clostridium sp.]MDY4253286.1 DegV family protein [Clostridium sp.]MDY6228221.1 DegV family protein [Clostridium sp.]
MEKIKILTDSCLDIPEELIEKNKIDILPVLINFGDKSYVDREEINLEEMLDKIEKEGVLPTTAQITPNRFEEYFRKALDEGYKVVAVLMSSNMSGTYNSACIAKEMVESDDITIIDTQVITSAQGFFVLKACELRDKGLSPEEIKVEIEKMIPKMKASLCFESLENLVRGGRISKTAGVIGTALGLRVIIGFEDGMMVAKDKTRGNKKVIKKIISEYENSDVDKNEPVMIIEIGSPEIKSELKSYLDENNIKYIETTPGCAVGIHSGLGACGLFFVTK